MMHARYTLLIVLRLLTLAAFCAISSAYADDYSEVNQLLRASKLNEAMVKADVYLAAKPRDPQMRFLKGVVQRNLGKSAEAIITFTKLIEDYPELPEPYNNLAVLYAGQSQYDKARAALEMAIRTNPSYATAHENLGDVYARLASQAYNKALQLDSSNAAVPPKLALIQELFSPGNKGQRPTAKPPVAAPAPVATGSICCICHNCSICDADQACQLRKQQRHTSQAGRQRQRCQRCRGRGTCLGQGLVCQRPAGLSERIWQTIHPCNQAIAQRLGRRTPPAHWRQVAYQRQAGKPDCDRQHDRGHCQIPARLPGR